MLADANVLLILALVLVAGTTSGYVARQLHLPSVTGQIFCGVLMGSSVLGVLPDAGLHSLDPMVDFALGLMAVAVGSHLSFRRLGVARRRLVFLLLFEATVTPLLVFVAVIAVSETTWYTALLLATIAISTAPATVLALVKETNSRGPFVTTLLAAVAINNLLCIILFEVARTVAKAAVSPGADSLVRNLFVPIGQIGFSLLLGSATGVFLILVTSRVVRSDRLTALSLIAILSTAGLAAHLGLSVLLACLCLGVTIANITPDREEVGHRVLDRFEPSIFAVFFVVAGMELKFSSLAVGGLVAAVAFATRLVGKLAAGYLGMSLAGTTQRFRNWIGLSLMPQAGLAVGLMLLVTEDPAFASIHELFVAVVLTMVLLNEIIGPFLTRMALRRSGESERDRARVLDFISEHNITTDLTGPTKEEAIRQLVDLTVTVHHLTIDADTLFEEVMKAEKVSSTCVGGGLALPHARLDVGDSIVGSMGICRHGLALDAPDGRPVRCMVLIVTPTSMPERHLEVLSALAASIGRDRSIQQRLYHIDSPAHAYELLHVDEEFEDWNYYIDEDPVTVVPEMKRR